MRTDEVSTLIECNNFSWWSPPAEHSRRQARLTLGQEHQRFQAVRKNGSTDTDTGFVVKGVLSLILVAVLSMTRVYGRSLAGVAGLNPAGGMDIYVVCVVQ